MKIIQWWMNNYHGRVGFPRAHDMDYHDPENMGFQVEKHRAVNIEVEDNDPLEEDDHAPENTVEDDGTNTLIHDTFSTGATDHDDQDDFDVVHDLLVLEKAYEPLYKGSQTTLLFVVLLMVNLKVMNGLSNIAISHMLRLIGDFLLPPSNILPRSYRELSAIMKDIGMEYQAIDACPNNHIIYHKQHEFATECPECHISRY
ncbi:uncharacterized protein LOC131075496 [Cryptomeria japonica]|uniref:uncharacterized protein LOC131075496 n=1 Tax=Cryptomeria japonica TaxID=3369 RepID=UPI0027DA4EA4|nr:uncharacterized protein LOC131075496 [Cryptomeria japonica]